MSLRYNNEPKQQGITGGQLQMGRFGAGSISQKDRRPDMKAAIQREVTAPRAIIYMEDYLQMEEGVKQIRGETRQTVKPPSGHRLLL